MKFITLLAMSESKTSHQKIFRYTNSHFIKPFIIQNSFKNKSMCNIELSEKINKLSNFQTYILFSYLFTYNNSNNDISQFIDLVSYVSKNIPNHNVKFNIKPVDNNQYYIEINTKDKIIDKLTFVIKSDIDISYINNLKPIQIAYMNHFAIKNNNQIDCYELFTIQMINRNKSDTYYLSFI